MFMGVESTPQHMILDFGAGVLSLADRTPVVVGVVACVDGLHGGLDWAGDGGLGKVRGE